MLKGNKVALQALKGSTPEMLSIRKFSKTNSTCYFIHFYTWYFGDYFYWWMWFPAFLFHAVLQTVQYFVQNRHN